MNQNSNQKLQNNASDLNTKIGEALLLRAIQLGKFDALIEKMFSNLDPSELLQGKIDSFINQINDLKKQAGVAA